MFGYVWKWSAYFVCMMERLDFLHMVERLNDFVL